MKNLGIIAILLFLLGACQTAPEGQPTQISDEEGPRQLEATDPEEPVKPWREPEVADEEQMDAARLASLLDDPALIAMGKDLYTARCAVCHGMEGQGGVGTALNDGHWEHGSDPIDIYLATWDGLPTMGMPRYSDMMNSKEVAAMVAYILHEFDPNYP